MKRFKVSCLRNNQKLNLKTRGNTIEVDANDMPEAAIKACKELQCTIVSVEEISAIFIEDRSSIKPMIYNDYGTRMIRDKENPKGYVRADSLPIHTRKE